MSTHEQDVAALLGLAPPSRRYTATFYQSEYVEHACVVEIEHTPQFGENEGATWQRVRELALQKMESTPDDAWQPTGSSDWGDVCLNHIIRDDGEQEDF